MHVCMVVWEYDVMVCTCVWMFGIVKAWLVHVCLWVFGGMDVWVYDVMIDSLIFK